MKVEIIPCLQDNYSYLIIDNEKQEACVVDPSEAKPIINYLNDKNIKLKYILNTHHHYCLLYTSPSPRDRQKSRMPSSA